ncbi:MAG TPA: diacylglycerol kinase family protein, partial [Chitinophagaceae bacterium]
MKRHIVYIINPVSGSGKRSRLNQQVEQFSTKAGVRFKIFPSVASGDYSFLRPIIREEKITDVVVAGGDGTLSQVVGSLLKEDVNFGIIPCGSGNGLAFTAGIPKDPAKALEMIFSQPATEVDGFMVNNQFSCMLSGVGFDAKVAHEFAMRPRRGVKTYAILVGKNFF